METNIISIGKAKGIILPSQFLKLNGTNNVVNIAFDSEKIIISPSKNVRHNWESIIKNDIKLNGEAQILLPDYIDNEIDKDWTW